MSYTYITSVGVVVVIIFLCYVYLFFTFWMLRNPFLQQKMTQKQRGEMTMENIQQIQFSSWSPVEWLNNLWSPRTIPRLLIVVDCPLSLRLTDLVTANASLRERILLYCSLVRRLESKPTDHYEMFDTKDAGFDGRDAGIMWLMYTVQEGEASVCLYHNQESLLFTEIPLRTGTVFIVPRSFSPFRIGTSHASQIDMYEIGVRGLCTK